MSKNIIKKTILLLIAGIIICLCGCGKRTVYKYDNQPRADLIEVKKAVYSKDKLVLYISGAHVENVSVYNSEFQTLGYDFDIKTGINKITIKGKNAEKISAVYLSSFSWEYQIRYIDSNQYALLAESWADDIGWKTVYEDENFYTAEEIAARKAREEERKKRQEEEARITKEIYDEFEGYYVCPDDERLYVNIYTDDMGARRIDTCRPDGQGDVFESSMYLANATLNEPDKFNNSPYISIECIFSDFRDQMSVMYSEDKTTLFFEDDGPVFVKK